MNDLRNIDKQYDAIRIELMRFSQIQNFLPERGRLTAVVRYYESIKAFVEVREHPLFWLQFAVACVTLNDFDRAESLFDTAYSLAKKRDRAMHQIDNHYARYLLERSIHKKDVISGITDFRKARRILNNQMALERRHYPYRIAILYRKFYDVFEDELDDKSKKEIKNVAQHVLNKINNLGERLRDNLYIRQCEKEMEDLLFLIEISENSNEN